MPKTVQGIIEYKESYELREVEVRQNPLDWQLRGLQKTQSGYGTKIPTINRANLGDGLFRRVYNDIYSNIGVCYVYVKGRKVYLH